MILVDVNSHKFSFPCPWDRFIDGVDQAWGIGPAPKYGWREFIDSTLASMGGINLTETNYIEFDTVEDALAFILKYGGIYEELDSIPDDNGSV